MQSKKPLKPCYASEPDTIPTQHGRPSDSILGYILRAIEPIVRLMRNFRNLEKKRALDEVRDIPLNLAVE